MYQSMSFAFVALLTMPGLAIAHEVTHKSLVIQHAWTRATPPGASTAAGYVTIRNTGDQADTLLSASAEFAGVTELHEDLITADGVMQMRPLKQGIEIAPGATVTLAPGGKHFMFLKLSKLLQRDLYFDGTFTFAKAGTVKVEFFVEPIGAKAAHQH
jgi:periplasmic copper chaperone A